jgi:hypothetical protein
VENFVGQFPILSLPSTLYTQKITLQMLSRLPAGALKKAGALGAATRSASVSDEFESEKGVLNDCSIFHFSRFDLPQVGLYLTQVHSRLVSSVPIAQYISD